MILFLIIGFIYKIINPFRSLSLYCNFFKEPEVKTIKLPPRNLVQLAGKTRDRFSSPLDDELCPSGDGKPCYTSKISYVQERQIKGTLLSFILKGFFNKSIVQMYNQTTTPIPMLVTFFACQQVTFCFFVGLGCVNVHDDIS